MGITLNSKNHSIDMGCGGFHRLRAKVAELTNEQLFAHYKKLDEGMFLTGDARNDFFTAYDKKIWEITEEYKIPEAVIMFIYSSDCKGKLTYGRCKKLYEIIKDYDDTILYGYFGREDCAKFKDFKEIVKDCADNKQPMKWS